MHSGSQFEPFDVEMEYCLEDMIHDLEQESFQQAHAPMYDTLQTNSKKPLYPRCKNSLTLLSVVLSLVNVKTRYGWNDILIVERYIAEEAIEFCLEYIEKAKPVGLPEWEVWVEELQQTHL